MNNNISWYDGDIYITSLKVLYNNVTFSKVYDEWKSRFIYIHGELDTQRKIDTNKLNRTFNININNTPEELFKFIYCLETYYSIILRILAHKSLFGENQYGLDIFDDKTFLSKGISNYTCVSYYNWFLGIPTIVTSLIEIYKDINLKDIDIEGDAISTIFECIFPKEIRHSIGEFYTPYWLANNVINQVTENDRDASMKKFIDPSCGSATFIVALINKYKTSSRNSIFFNVCGIDINPLTVLAAKTNYLLLFCKEIGTNDISNLEIPIYCADTIAINDDSTLFLSDLQEYDSVPKEKYDYIVGNPPWVNWEYMPDTYRINHVQLWQYYGLFSQKGINANFIKEDISVLLTYVVIDKYLKIGGRIGFILKETLFKSIKQGEGFRKFKIIPHDIALKVLRVDDLTKLSPFRDAITRTAIIYIEKGKATNYPVDYVVWHPLSKIKSFENNRLFNLSDYMKFEKLKARPSIKGEINSGWITESEEEMSLSPLILGSNKLVARTGVFTGGANGIYWLSVDSEHDNNVVVSNITERAKNKMKKVHMEIEKDFVFPFLTGNDLGFWSYSYSKYILCPHTPETKMYPINGRVLKMYPLTEHYFMQFKKELEDRKGFTSMDKPIHDQFYYALQRIGIYTFAKYKVCWRYICKSFTPAVVEYANDNYLGEKNIIGNEKIISIGTNNRDEAYYLCAVISSTLYRRTIENYMVGTQITPSIIGRLNIPSFDSNNEQHLELSRLCREGHQMQGSKTLYVQEIDNIIKTWLT